MKQNPHYTRTLTHQPS